MAATLAALKVSIMDKTVVPVVLESVRLFPDGLVITTGLYALMTLSVPYAVMFGSFLEATLLFQFIKSVASYLQVADLSVAGNVASPLCRTGFSGADLSSLSLFGNILRSSFPSAPLYILSVAASYVFSSLHAQAQELQALGSSYSSRYYISLIATSLLLLLFMLSRAYNSCDSLGVIVATVPIGLLVGWLLLQQNIRLFGRGSVNLLGIPLMVNKVSVCQAPVKS